MTRLEAVHRSAPAPQSSRPVSRLDAQLRAAGILGRIIDFFDSVDACSTEVLERTRGLLVEELELGRADATRAPHDSRRRNAVFASALACVQDASERGARRTAPRVESPSWLPTPGGAPNQRRVRPGTIILQIHHVLDGVATLHDPTPAQGRPRGVDVLAHMLRGPEPRTWSRAQQDFARCALEWMRSGAEDPGPDDPTGPRRWSTAARRGAALRLRSGHSKGAVRSA